MLPQLRDSSTLDNTSLTSSVFEVPLPRTDPGDPSAEPPVPPTLSIQDGDQGVLVLVWSADSGTPYTALHTDWTVSLAPTVAHQICVAVLTHRHVAAADPPFVHVSLDASRRVLALGLWYAATRALDLGVVAVNPKGVSTTARAPSVVASGLSDELMLAVFASATNTGPASMTVTDTDPVLAAPLLERSGIAGTAMISVAPFPSAGVVPSGDVVAHYNQNTQSRAGIQLGLLASSAGVGGAPQLRPTVTLAVSGTPVLADLAQFGSTVGLDLGSAQIHLADFTATVTLSVLANHPVAFTPAVTLAILAPHPADFAPGVTLAARTRVYSRVSFTAHVGLAVTSTKVLGRAYFWPRVHTGVLGHPSVGTTAAFGSHVTLAATGIQRLFGRPHLSSSLSVSATGAMYLHRRITFGTSVALTATGTALVFGSPARFRPAVRLYTRPAPVRTSGTAHFTPTLSLAAWAGWLGAFGTARFGLGVDLAVHGVPDFTPVVVARFGLAVTLAADGFTRPGKPVGITVKPVPVQTDPDWHGPRGEYEWSTE